MRSSHVFPGGVCQEVRHDFGIGGGAEVAAPLLAKLDLKVEGVDHVAVVAKGQVAVDAFDQEWLSVTYLAGAGCGVAGVGYCHLARKWPECFLAEHLGHQAHFRVDLDGAPVGGGDTGALLATMLEGEDAEKRDAAGVPTRCVYRHHPALFPRVVERHHRLRVASHIVHARIITLALYGVNIIRD